MAEPDKKNSAIVYDYWIDIKRNKIFALVEYTNIKIDEKHSNVFLVSKDYHGE